jgi:hypothetical protein
MKRINLIYSALVLIVTVSLGFAMRTETKPAPVETVKVEPQAKDQSQDVRDVALANGFTPSERIVNAILRASETYQIDSIELTAIAIVETGLGKNAKTRVNSNGTKDHGLFQINTVNAPKCVEYNLDSPEGSALCAAKLLSQIKARRADYLGVYHSKTPSRKLVYMQKLDQVMSQTDNK